MKRGLVSWLLFACLLAKAAAASKTSLESFQSGGRKVLYEVFGSAATADAGATGPLIILLSGDSGPDTPFSRGQAAFFAAHGYTTLLLHYFDAARSHTPSVATYTAWSGALAELVRTVQTTPAWKGRPIFVVSYSLGASIALAAGSQKLAVQGMAIWYGSLPDDFFFRLQGMPPLLILHGARDNNIPVINAQQLIRLCGLENFECQNHIYPNEGHGFSADGLRDADRRTLEFLAGHEPAVRRPPNP